jgi:hypothetical protein
MFFLNAGPGLCSEVQLSRNKELAVQAYKSKMRENREVMGKLR